MGVVNAILWDEQKHPIGSVFDGANNFWRLAVDASGSGGVPNRPSFATGLVAVPVPGTGVNFPAQPIPDGFSIFIRAGSANAGTVYVGNSQANAQNPAVAFPLLKGEFIRLFITNANLVWIDATGAGEGVAWVVET